MLKMSSKILSNIRKQPLTQLTGLKGKSRIKWSFSWLMQGKKFSPGQQGLRTRTTER